MTWKTAKTDVFVVGGGPAGLAVAIAARRKGFEVMLADGAAPPIDKPCGEGMMPGTQAALSDLGIVVPACEGYRFRGIQFVSGDVRIGADFPRGQGIGIRRTVLHELMLREAERIGVSFHWKTPVRAVGANEVRLSNETVTARWIVGADGGGSRVRRWAGLDFAVESAKRSAVRRHYRIRPWSEHMEIHWAPRAQAYVTPISSEQVCIVVMAENQEDGDFEHALASMPELRERLAGGAVAGLERGAITAMHSLRRVTRGNIALAGDASGGVDAITGEGLRLAFRQALALGEAMELGDLSRYESAHRRLALRPMWMGKLMLQLGKHDWLRRRAMRAMRHAPGLFERLLAIHVGQASPADVFAAGAQFGWEFLAAARG